MLRQVIEAKQSAACNVPAAHPVLLRKVESISKGQDSTDQTCTTDGSDVDISRHLAKAEERQRSVLRSISSSSINMIESQKSDGTEFDISMIESLCSLLSTEGHEVMLVAYRHDLKKCFKFGSETGRKYLSQFPAVMQNFIKFCEDTYNGTAEQVSPAGEVHYNIMGWDKSNRSQNLKPAEVNQISPPVSSYGLSGITQGQKQITQTDSSCSENERVPVALSSPFPVQKPSFGTIQTSLYPVISTSAIPAQLSQTSQMHPQICQMPTTTEPISNITVASGQGVPVIPVSPSVSNPSNIPQTLTIGSGEKASSLPVVTDSKQDSINSKFKCFVCEEVMPTKVLLQQHLMAHSQRWFKCPHCNRLFFRQVDCDRHAVVHGKREHEKCQFCDVTYVSKVGKNRHLKRRHPVEWKRICQQTVNLEKKGIKCPFCSSTFQSVEKMKRHMRYHKKKLTITKCYICSKEFETTQLLEEHVKSHTISLVLSCEFCEEKFDNHIKLQQHKSVCTKAVFSCGVCSFIFNTEEELENHKLEEGHGEEDEEDAQDDEAAAEEDTESLHSLKISSVVSCASDSTFTMGEDAQTAPGSFHEVSYDNNSSMASVARRELESGDGEEETEISTDIKVEPEDYIEENMSISDVKTETEEDVDDSITGMDTSYDSSSIMNDTEQSMDLTCWTNENGEVLDDEILGQQGKSLYSKVCYFCGKLFHNKRAFSKHLKIHMHKGKFKCLYCDYTYSRPDAVGRHMKIHEKGHDNEAKQQILPGTRPILPKGSSEGGVVLFPIVTGGGTPCVSVPSTAGHIMNITGNAFNASLKTSVQNDSFVNKKSSMEPKASEYLPKPWAKNPTNFLRAPKVGSSCTTEHSVSSIPAKQSGSTPQQNVSYSTVSFIPVSAPASIDSSPSESVTSASLQQPSALVRHDPSSISTTSGAKLGPSTLCHCLTCNADFTSYDKLQEHMKEHEDKQEYPCHFCKKPFPSLEARHKHMLSAKDVCRFGCEYCGDVMPTRFHLWNHRKIHAKDGRNYSCYIDGCTKRFTSHRVLKKHIVSLHVTKENVDYFDFTMFHCQECDKLFSLKSDLDFHARTHREKPPLDMCNICGKMVSSTDKRSMQRHLLRHRNEPPEKYKYYKDRQLTCHICNKMFSTKIEQEQHLKSVHMFGVGENNKELQMEDTVIIDSESSDDEHNEVDKGLDDDEIEMLTGVTPLDPYPLIS